MEIFWPTSMPKKAGIAWTAQYFVVCETNEEALVLQFEVLWELLCTIQQLRQDIDDISVITWSVAVETFFIAKSDEGIICWQKEWLSSKNVLKTHQ